MLVKLAKSGDLGIRRHTTWGMSDNNTLLQNRYQLFRFHLNRCSNALAKVNVNRPFEMKYCVLCKTHLSENEKPEHILLDALGGRKTTRDVLCSICNNKMGAGPDKDLGESVAALRTIVNLKSGSRKKAPSLHVEPASGEAYELSPEGVPIPKIKKRLDFGEDDAGNKTILINARDEGQLEQLLKAAVKALNLSSEAAEALISAARKEAVVKSGPASQFTRQIQFGSGRSLESMVKACLVLWAEFIGNAEVHSDRYDEVREFALNSTMPAFENFTFGTDTRQMLEVPTGFGENANVIWVGSNDAGVVRGYFNLYGAVGWTFTLCEGSPHRNKQTVLISDPMNPSQWVCGPEHADILNFDWISARPRYGDIDWTGPQAKIAAMMAHGHQQMRNNALLQIIQETLLEFSVVEGGPIPKDKIAEISKQFARKLTYLVMTIPHEELLQDRKENGEI